jgi:hypothetical protein
MKPKPKREIDSTVQEKRRREEGKKDVRFEKRREGCAVKSPE